MTDVLLGDDKPAAPAPPPTASPATPATSRRDRWAVRGVVASVALLLLCVSAVAIHWGTLARHDAWEPLHQMRHWSDINNCWNQGLAVNDAARELAIADGRAGDQPFTWGELGRAFVNRYNVSYVNRDADSNGDRYDFDYVPIRLLVATLWVHHEQALARADGREVRRWQPDRPFTAPLLTLNLFVQYVAILAAAWVVWLWTRLASTPTILQSLRNQSLAWPRVKPLLLGWLAGMLLWFDPSVMFETSVWPQWDAWIVPFFLLAIGLAMADWWLAAGVLLGVGAMCKGQLLLVAPIVVLWPLFEGRFGTASRAAIGLALGVFAVGSPWLVPTRPAAWAMASFAAASLLIWPWIGRPVLPAAEATPLARRLRSKRLAAFAATCIAITTLTLWPWPARWHVVSRPPFWTGVTMAAALVTAPLHTRRRRTFAFVFAALLVLSLLLVSMLYEGSWAWWEIGVGYGTHHYLGMYIGTTSNLPAILNDRHGWRIESIVPPLLTDWVTWPLNGLGAWFGKRGGPPAWHVEPNVTIRAFLQATYFITLALCAAGAARHHRRRDPRLLVALAAPWVIFFALLCQMHERYWLWAGAITAIGAGVSLGAVLLHVVVCLTSLAFMLRLQLPGDHSLWPTVQFDVSRIHPGIGWLVMLVAAIYLYYALAPSRPVHRLPSR